jgi:hypothetical protein
LVWIIELQLVYFASARKKIALYRIYIRKKSLQLNKTKVPAGTAGTFQTHLLSKLSG